MFIRKRHHLRSSITFKKMLCNIVYKDRALDKLSLFFKELLARKKLYRKFIRVYQLIVYI